MLWLMRRCRGALIVCLLGLSGPAFADAVTVFAAASLKTALDDAVARWSAQTGTEVRLSFAGSSVLARQIAQGAPADLFISANRGWMRYLAEQGAIDLPTQRDLVGNTLVLVGPAGAPPIVFFQVPNAAYVFGDLAFWDVYYEHCSYFSLGALARLFRQEGFEVLDLWSAYEDQYLMIAARPGESAAGPTPPLPQEDDLAAIAQAVTHFTTHCPPLRAQWRAEIERLHSQGQRIVLWGGGSKGVSFLTTLGLTEQIEYVVDINPHKAGTFMAGTGQEIVLPTFLTGYRPDVVIVMNPIYRDEIQRSLQALGLSPDLRTV